MTVTTVVPADPATAGVAAPSRATRARAQLQAGLQGSPGRLRIALALAALAGIVLALLGGQAFRVRVGALDQARADVQQLVRVQGIRTNLVRADAQGTNAFLVGGLESKASRDAYDAAIAAASRDIVAAAQANPDDAAALARVAQTVSLYAGRMETARANNRQGNQVGTAYLGQATKLLRTDALPPLTSVVAADQERVRSGYDDASGALLLLAATALIALVALIGVQLWLARRTHRYLNVPLLTATGASVLAVAVGLIVMVGVQTRADHVRDGPYSAAVGLAQARIAGFDAKSAENLTLINRGSGQQNEKDWQTATGLVRAGLATAGRTGVGSDAAAAYNTYAAVHGTIRKQDDGGDWDTARQTAIDAAAKGGNGTFKVFADSSDAALRDQEDQVITGLDAAHWWLIVAGLLALLAGLTAALLGGLGVLQRLEEYR